MAQYWVLIEKDKLGPFGNTRDATLAATIESQNRNGAPAWIAPGSRGDGSCEPDGPLMSSSGSSSPVPGPIASPGQFPFLWLIGGIGLAAAGFMLVRRRRRRQRESNLRRERW